jgi:hypothetical protein
MQKLFVFVVATWLVFSSCSKGREINYSTDEIILTASGPIMEGANTATADFTLALNDFLQKNGSSLAELSDARLQKATLSLPDSLDNGLMSEITLQLAADAADMQKVAVLNPVPEGKKVLELQVAQEQNGVEKILKQNKMTFVADFNAKKEMENDLVLKGKFEFVLTVK